MATIQTSDLADGDYDFWQVRDECRRVGCDRQVVIHWQHFNESIQHGEDVYPVAPERYAVRWQRIRDWLDTLHAPLVAARQAEQDRQLMLDSWPLLAVDPLLGG